MPKRNYRVKEVWASGVDPLLQGVGGSPRGGKTGLGLRVPTLASPSITNRYLFMLCGFEVGEHTSGFITGLRQLWTLFCRQTTEEDSPVTSYAEIDVTSPTFRLADGNVSWHLRRVEKTVPFSFAQSTGPSDLDGLQWRMAQSSALLYETVTNVGQYYMDLTAYVPPNTGVPPGDPIAGIGDMVDSRWDWRNSQGWSSLDIPIHGPAFYGLFASVRQSAGATVIPAINSGATLSFSPEMSFVNAYTSANTPGDITTTGVIIGRVGGAIVCKLDTDNARDPVSSTTPGGTAR